MTLAVRAALLGLPLLAALPGTLPSAHATEAAAPRSYDIPAGPLAGALLQFAQQSGIQLSAAAALTAGLESNGVRGQHHVDTALTSLLAGTGLEAVHRGGNEYTLRRLPVQPGAATLTPVTVRAETERESAWGPVQGYVAKRSATGTKTDTPIVETPQTISVVPAEQIDTLKAQNLNDVFAYTPGISIANVSGPTTDMFTIRGFTSASHEILRDGLRFMVNTFDGRQEPYGLERVEVLKGASSILYGAVAPGGIVNTVTKRPTTDKIREINVEAGSFNRKQISGDFAGPLTDDGTWSYRLTALHRGSDSFVDHVSDDRTYFAPALKWQPNASTSLTLLANYQHERTAFLYGFPAEGTVLSNPNGRISRSRCQATP